MCSGGWVKLPPIPTVDLQPLGQPSSQLFSVAPDCNDGVSESGRWTGHSCSTRVKDYCPNDCTDSIRCSRLRVAASCLRGHPYRVLSVLSPPGLMQAEQRLPRQHGMGGRRRAVQHGHGRVRMPPGVHRRIRHVVDRQHGGV